jgi:hypothetical protein
LEKHVKSRKETAAKKVESKDTSDGVTEARPSDSDGGAGGSDRGVKGGVEGGGGLLRICKHSFCFEFDVKATPPALAQKKEIVAVLGVLLLQSEAFLVVVTAAEFVGEVCGAAVWGVRKVDMLPFLMLSSPSAISRSSEVLKELGSLNMALCHHGFYFSYAVDLSDPACLTSRAAVYSREKGAAESEKVLNTDFCWNKEMMSDFAALPGQLSQEWAAPLIQGACHGDRLEKCDVLILARRRRDGGQTVAEGLRVDVFLEEGDFVVSKEFAAAMTASGGNIRDAGESVSDALLDLRLPDQGNDAQELREEGLELALKRLWSICALNLYRQATYSELPESGMGAPQDDAQKEIASKLSAPVTTAPWLRRLVSSGWQLRVGLIHAQHLPKTDISGSADPYVTLDITGQKQRKSKTIKNTLSPEWKEEFVFALMSVPRKDDKAELVMTVWSYDTPPKKDKVLGEVRFRLADLAGKSSTHHMNVMKPFPVEAHDVRFGTSETVFGKDGEKSVITISTSFETFASSWLWKCHGKCVSLAPQLWETRTLRVWCGTWNAAGKVLETENLKAMMRGTSDKWREGGAQICFLGLQEAVELDMMSTMASFVRPAQRFASEGSKAFVDKKGKPTPLGACKTNVDAAFAVV